MRRYRSSRPRRSRGLTTAQQAANAKAWANATHTTTGNFARGMVVAGADGATYKITTYGRAYHEDCNDAAYGLRPSRGPKGWAQTQELRRAISRVLREGTHEPNSRGGDDGARAKRPAGEELAAWRDSQPGSLAHAPVLRLYSGGVIGVARPNYDDSPSVAWLHDAPLARRLAKAIAACPAPVHLPRASVREHFARVSMATDDPRYAAYAAGRDAEATTDGVRLPRGEYLRIKAELTAAE